MPTPECMVNLAGLTPVGGWDREFESEEAIIQRHPENFNTQNDRYRHAHSHIHVVTILGVSVNPIHT